VSDEHVEFETLFR